MPSSPYEADFYERLGLDSASDARLIRSQYRLLARLFHPDVNPTPGAQQRFLALRAAYEVLSDEEARADYNRWLARHPSRHQEPIRFLLQHHPTHLPRSLGTQRLYTMLDIVVDNSVPQVAIPLNLILVLDRSSSMKGQRLHYVREAARRIVATLAPTDVFGLVTFNDRATVMLPSGRGTEPTVAQSAIASIQATGGTEMASGLRAGVQEVLRHHSPQGISHIILLTDGRTYGDEALCQELTDRAHEQGIGLTLLGLGTDWNDELLDDLARRAQGSAHFIAHPQEAVALFQEQVQQLQRTYARHAELRVECGPGVRLLHAHEVAPGLKVVPQEGTTLALGSLPSSPTVRLLLDFEVSLPERDVLLLTTFHLRAQNVISSLYHRVERFVAMEAGELLPERADPDIYQAAHRVATLRLQARAWDAVGQGNAQEASSALEQLADRFLEIGAMELAYATQREIVNYHETGTLSDDGRKIIKYGTRMLALPTPEERAP